LTVSEKKKGQAPTKGGKVQLLMIFCRQRKKKKREKKKKKEGLSAFAPAIVTGEGGILTCHELAGGGREKGSVRPLSTMGKKGGGEVDLCFR